MPSLTQWRERVKRAQWESYSDSSYHDTWQRRVRVEAERDAALEALKEAQGKLDAVGWVRQTRPHSTLTCRLPWGEKPHTKAECDRCALDAILSTERSKEGE